MDLQGKNALVTGAARRIGRALTLRLTESGMNVAVHYNSSDSDAQQTVDSAVRLGAKAQAFKADLQDPQQLQELVDNVTNTLGRVDVLINNASLYTRAILADTTHDSWDRHMNINARAPFILAKLIFASRPVSQAQTLGKVVNLGDWRSTRKNRFAYGVSKHALTGVTRSLALALAPNVQVNEVALGEILPPPDSTSSTSVQPLGPSNRMGTLNEVAAVVMSFLKNDFLTGTQVILDGGNHLR